MQEPLHQEAAGGVAEVLSTQPKVQAIQQKNHWSTKKNGVLTPDTWLDLKMMTEARHMSPHSV